MQDPVGQGSWGSEGRLESGRPSAETVGGWAADADVPFRNGTAGGFAGSWTSVAALWATLSPDHARLAGGALVIDEDGRPSTLAPSVEGPFDAAVLGILTSEVEQPPRLPEGGDLVVAPLGSFDAVELTMFGRAAARGHIAFGDGLAVVGLFSFEAGASEGELRPVVLSGLAEAAFLEGAEVIYTIAGRLDVPSLLEEGWSEVVRLRYGS